MLNPKSASPDMADAYNPLEGAIFRLKVHRPDLKIGDRFYLLDVREEHRFQLTGAVADDSAIRIGRVFGVNTVLIYGSTVLRIEIGCGRNHTGIFLR